MADIVKFIQHKVLTCNKENYCGDKKKAENGTEVAVTADNEEAASLQPTSEPTASSTSASSEQPTSILAAATTTTLTRRHSISTTTEVKSSLLDNNNTTTTGTEVKAELDPVSLLRRVQRSKAEYVDAESNTFNSGKKMGPKLWSVRSGYRDASQV